MIGAHLRKRYSFPQSILKTFHSQGPDKDQQSNGSRYNRFEVNQCKIANMVKGSCRTSNKLLGHIPKRL